MMYRINIKICLALSVLATGVVAHTHDRRASDHHDHHHDHQPRGLQEEEEQVALCGTKALSAEEMAQVEADLKRWQARNGVCNSTYCPLRVQVPEVAVSTVWHNIQRSDGTGGVTTTQITAAMAAMNIAYANTGFTFSLIQTTETKNSDYYTKANGGTSTELAMKTALKKGDQTTLNIYSVDLSAFDGLLGYAYYPNNYARFPIYDGVVLDVSTVPGGTATLYNEGDVLVHEVGHWILLAHPFEGEGCTTDGDGVDDTPFQSTASGGCPTGKDSCPAANGVDNINNYMDYSYDSCKFLFTNGQIARMVTAWNTYRGSGPTPSPTTPAPTPGPSCFSEDATAIVQNRGSVEMTNLALGEKVLTADGFHTLYAFAHKARKTPQEFLQISTKEFNPLQISRQHLVFVQGKPHPVPAQTIQIGDMLQSTQWPNGVLVTKITSLNKDGLYAPITTDGTIVVDGIVSSCYIALQNNANEYFELQGGVSTSLSQHFLVHLGMAPVRMACNGISPKLCQLYDQEGLAYFAKIGFALFDFIERQTVLIQVLLLALYFIVFGSFFILECIFGPKVAVLAALALTAAGFARGVLGGQKKKLD